MNYRTERRMLSPRDSALPDGSLCMLLSVAVPARRWLSQPIPSVRKIHPRGRGNSISQTTTATYGAKTEYHRDTSLLGISTENREFQDKENSSVPGRLQPLPELLRLSHILLRSIRSLFLLQMYRLRSELSNCEHRLIGKTRTLIC
jgi:hypothetical protein